MPKRFRTKEYIAWRNMMVRCYNEGSSGYQNYGGRGIKVCLEWHTYSSFLRDMGVSPLGTQLDRKDNEAGYFKENCHWASPAQNAQNRRNNKLTAEKVKWIRAISASVRAGVTRNRVCKILAVVFGVSKNEIHQILDNKIWKE